MKINIRGDEAGDWLEGLAPPSWSRRPKSGRPGHLALLAKMAETLFIEALASLHAASCRPSRPAGSPAHAIRWSAAALALLHRTPRHAWTVSEIATAVGALTLGPGGAVRTVARRAAAHLPGPLALAACRKSAADDAQDDPAGRIRCRLRVRGCVQSRVQARVRSASGAVPKAACRRRRRSPWWGAVRPMSNLWPISDSDRRKTSRRRGDRLRGRLIRRVRSRASTGPRARLTPQGASSPFLNSLSRTKPAESGKR